MSGRSSDAALASVTLRRGLWGTVMASLFSEACSVRLPPGKRPEDTDEWQLAVAIRAQLPGADADGVQPSDGGQR